MKPPDFDYLAAREVGEAVAMLAQYGDRAKLLAGGQSLVPLLNFRLVQPEILIDVSRLSDLSSVREEGGGIRIGALTRHRQLELSPLVQNHCPILAEASKQIGHLSIRNRGTFGGSLAHADPAAELPMILLLLDGSVRAKSAAGERTIDAQDFFLGYLTTALTPSELLVEGWLPALGPQTGWGFHELTMQHGGFAIVAVGALITLDDRGRCAEARLVVGNGGPVPIRAREAEEGLVEPAIQEAARLVTGATDPTGDLQASVEYRIEMIRVLAARALRDALARAKAGVQ